MEREYNPEQTPDPEETSRFEALKQVTAEYLDADDAAFLDELDTEEERINYVFGRLLELGENPEEVLMETGVIEREAE